MRYNDTPSTFQKLTNAFFVTIKNIVVLTSIAVVLVTIIAILYGIASAIYAYPALGYVLGGICTISLIDAIISEY